MTEEKNGTTMNGLAADKPPEMSKQDMMLAMVDGWIWPCAVTLVNGVRTALMQHNIPIGFIMVRVCALMGRVVGETLSQGDITAILGIRGDCVKAFTEGLRAVEIKAPPMPGTADTRLPSQH